MGGHTVLQLDPVTFDLPQTVYRLIHNRLTNDVGDKQAEAYGYNGGDDWETPEALIRWVQPMESDLAKQCEYDMDEQDQEWLTAVNAERQRVGQPAVSYEFFEIIMDRLEKEWFDLSRQFPKDDSGLVPAEDSKCAICEDGDTENSNAIVFCDGCNLAVHQDCYGVPYIPEGQWLCRKCTVSPDKPVTCVLCPNSYGAFKQTTENQWAHLICAIHVPETGVSNAMYMEPIDGVKGINKQRWKLKCYLCKKPRGACIQCSKTNCFTAYHVTCAQDNGLYLKMKGHSSHFDGPNETRSFCDRHTPREHIEALEATAEARANADALLASSRGESPKPQPPPPRKQDSLTQIRYLRMLATGSQSRKSARAYRKTYASSGPPIVPAYVYDRVLEYISKLRTQNRKAIVSQICRYWSLKREARRGAPLLKRLHLEPWTASAANKQQTEEDRERKFELLDGVRKDLERVRMLAESARRRERTKLARAQLQKEVIDSFLFPHAAKMRSILQSVVDADKSSYFLTPVNRLEVPDYYDVIKEPMSWSVMDLKLDQHEYVTVEDFAADIRLVITNAMTYNKQDSPFHKAALRVSRTAEPLLLELAAQAGPAGPTSEELEQIQALFTSDTIEDLLSFHYVWESPPPAPPPEPTPPPEEEEVEQAKPSHKKKGPAVDLEGSARAASSKHPGLLSRELEGLLNAAPGFAPGSSRRESSSRTTRGSQLLPSDPTLGSSPARPSLGRPPTRSRPSIVEPVAQPAPSSSTRKAVPFAPPRLTRHMIAAEKALLPDGATTDDEASASPGKKLRAAEEQRKRDEKNAARREANRLQREKRERELERRRAHTAALKQDEAGATPASEETDDRQDAAAKSTEGSKRMKYQSAWKMLPQDPQLIQEAPTEAQAMHLFHAGWILPEGSKRRSAAMHSVPPPRPAPKKLTQPRKSGASAGEAARGESKPDHDGKQSSPLTAMSSDAMDVDEDPTPRKPTLRSASAGEEMSPADAKLIAELARHDRPVRGSKRKSTAEQPPTTPGPSRLQVLEERGDGTQLVRDEATGEVLIERIIVRSGRQQPKTPRADVDVDHLPKDERGFRIFPPAKGQKSSRNARPHATTLKAFAEMTQRTQVPSGRLADGTLVWAKISGQPWYPAEVSDEDDERVPPNVLAQKPDTVGSPVLVCFFGDTRPWSWVQRGFVHLMTEDPEMDALLQSPALEPNGSTRRKIKEAYAMAMEDSLTEEGDAE